jgi:hypothetical protein
LVELKELDHKLWFACVFFVTCSTAIALDVTVQQFKESPGPYYDCIGEMQLMTVSGLLEIMHICPLTLAKSMNINFGLITLVV